MAGRMATPGDQLPLITWRNAMLAHTVHDVRVIPEVRELPPEDGWRCWGQTGYCRIQCSCGHTDGPILKVMARLTAEQHILSGA